MWCQKQVVPNNIKSHISSKHTKTANKKKPKAALAKIRIYKFVICDRCGASKRSSNMPAHLRSCTGRAVNKKSGTGIRSVQPQEVTPKKLNFTINPPVAPSSSSPSESYQSEKETTCVQEWLMRVSSTILYHYSIIITFINIGQSKEAEKKCINIYDREAPNAACRDSDADDSHHSRGRVEGQGSQS